jgi:retron-type reverse transcriptase
MWTDAGASIPSLTRFPSKAITRISTPPSILIDSFFFLRDNTNISTSHGNKAVGVDEVIKSMYAEDLEANLQDLSARLKRMGYCPQPKRRTYIPKLGSEKGRRRHSDLSRGRAPGGD